MKNHVTSLELSKELDKLLPDNKENCNFYWHKGKLVFPHSELGCHAIGDWDEYYPAYLSSELGEILPVSINDNENIYRLTIWRNEKDWTCFYGAETSIASVKDIILSDCLAKMLIFLIKNNLIKL